MEEDKQVARLWRVNRTIHELVRDRVCLTLFVYFLVLASIFLFWTRARHPRAARGCMHARTCCSLVFSATDYFSPCCCVLLAPVCCTCPKQGYQVSDEEINISLADFQAVFAPSGNVDRKALNFFAEADRNDPLHPTPEGEEPEKIFVFYSEEANVGVKTIRQFIGALDQQGINRGIIIWSEKLTPAAKKVLEAMQQQFVLEDFDEASLLVNITHHTLVPTHEVMTPLEKKELLAR